MNSITSSKIKKLIFYVLGIIFVLFLMVILNLVTDNDVIFPKVTTILIRFFKLLGKKYTYDILGISVYELTLALIWGSILGITIGTLSGINSNIDYFLKPLMTILRSTPMIIVIVIVMVLNPGEPGSYYETVPYICGTLIITPIIAEAIKAGINSIDPKYIDAYKLFSNTTPRVIFKIHFPLIKNSFKEAYINAISMGLKIVITTEYVVAINKNYGQEILLRANDLDYDYVYAYALIVVILISLIELIPYFIGKVYSVVINKEAN